MREKYQKIMIPLMAILISFIVGGLIILSTGKNPLDAYTSLLQGAGILSKASYAANKGMLTDFMSTLNMLTPMIFAALAVAVAFKTGLFNIGVSGQMLLGGFIASILIGYSDLPAYIAKPSVIIIGALMGALVGALIGWLKYKFNINEVVSSIMLNYILQYVISFFINVHFMNPVSRQSRNISQAARLTLIDVEMGGIKFDLPLGFFLAIPTIFIVKFMLDKTRMGYEMRTVGLNKQAAKYAGMNVGKNMVLAMTISGLLAGIAGVTFYLGYFSSIQPKVLSTVGFDAIAVSLLGNSNPIGIFFSASLITIISRGSNYMSSSVGVQPEITQVITAVILLFSACSAYIAYALKSKRQKAVVPNASADNVSESLDNTSSVEKVEEVQEVERGEK